jgi:hypothetical protein
LLLGEFKSRWRTVAPVGVEVIPMNLHDAGEIEEPIAGVTHIRGLPIATLHPALRPAHRLIGLDRVVLQK